MVFPILPVPQASATSAWISAWPEDFNGTGMELDNCTLERFGAGGAIHLKQSGNWMNLNLPRQPSADWAYGLAPVGNQDRIVIYGGEGRIAGGMRYINETWVYDIRNNTWKQMAPITNPGFRSSPAMAPVLNDDRVLLFGGDHGSAPPTTWVYDLGDDQWYLQTPQVHPGWRAELAMAPIYNSTEIVLFGGTGDRFMYCDTWIFDTAKGQWAEVTPLDHPPPRYRHAMAPVWSTDQAVLFGGSYNREYYNDTWIFDAGERRWYEKKPANSPPPRESPGMTGLFRSDSVFLFGGWPASPNGKVLDTWIYNSTDVSWEQRYPSDYPKLPSSFELATSREDGNVIMYGDKETWAFNFSLFQRSGVFGSPYHDMGGDSKPISICWTIDAPEDTSIFIRIRTGQSLPDLMKRPFLGPDGTDATHYDEESTLWWGHFGNRYIQYQTVLRTSNLTRTPVLAGVRIDFNRIPGIPAILRPSDGEWTNTGNPVFAWTFNDSDSRSQGGFELQLSKTSNFSAPDYSSGVVDSDKSNFVLNEMVDDGMWHWRVRTRDLEGDWGPFTKDSTLGIDTVPPEEFLVEANPPTWTRGPCTISFNTSDATSGVYGHEVVIDNSNYGFQESPFTVPPLPDGPHKIVVSAYDLAGNRVESGTRIFIDNGAPAPFTPAASIPSWTNTSPQISFQAWDSASGIDQYEVRIDQSAFSVQTSPYWLPDLPDGEHAITVRAYDKVGNYRDGQVSIFLDRSGPIDLLLSANIVGWTNTDPQISFNASDTVSGIDHFEVSQKSGVFVVRTSPFMPTDLEEGANIIYIRAFDRAGNHEEGSLTLNIDKTAPEKFTPSAAPAGWTRSFPVIGFNAIDKTSGIDRYELRIDNGSFKVQSSPANLLLIPDGKHCITVRAFDRAGNFRDGTVDVFMDSSPPFNVSFGLAGGNANTHQKDVTLIINSTDGLSGLDAVCFSNDGLEYTPWEPYNTSKAWSLSPGYGKKTIFLKIRDKAGNEATASVNIDYMPPSAPALLEAGVATAAILVAAGTLAAILLHRRQKKRSTKR
jgi:hypothetical protein